MSTLPLEEKRNKVILALYHLHTTKGPHVDTDELEELSEVGLDFYPILREVGRNGRGWLHHANLRVRILPPGIEKAEELLKMQMVEKERLVLKKIYDLGGPTHLDWVSIDRLQKELGMTFRELNGILLDFERKKGWAEGPDEAIGLTPAAFVSMKIPGVMHEAAERQFTMSFMRRFKAVLFKVVRAIHKPTYIQITLEWMKRSVQ